MTNRGQLIADQDDILIAITSRRPITPAMVVKLPPWRAVLLVGVAEAAGKQVVGWPLAEIKAEALRVGGAGTLVAPEVAHGAHTD